MDSSVVLQIDNLVVDYGIIRAIKDVSMKFNRGQIIAILGANGAGKSTLIRSIMGLVKVKSGKITYLDHAINNKEPYKIASLGILLSPEGRQILRGLTVEENLLVGAYSLRGKTIMKDDQKVYLSKKVRTKMLIDQVFEYFPILKERRRQAAATLSGGEQQMLAIGRALMGDAEVLLLDEPSLGLAPLIIKDIFNIIKEIKKSGRTIIIVEQNAYLTLKIADYAYVLELGKIKVEGKASKLVNNSELIHAYLGSK